ncbi:hypothetical protein U1Q18_030202 [Sarracenia purpurea var. burkii]
MASNQSEGFTDDFLEQILAFPSYSGVAGTDGSSCQTTVFGAADSGSGLQHPFIPLSLSLDNGRDDVNSGAFVVGKSERESVNMASLFPVFEHSQPHSVHQAVPLDQQVFHGQPIPSTTVTVPHPPSIRPRVRARRGQATDPHSIAERTDRAAMLDEIVDYVKFLRLQVKVLSMSRLGGAGAVAQLVYDIPLTSIEGDSSEVGSNHAWDKWSDRDIEQEVAKLMEEDVGAAMQYLQSKALCMMPISLASLIYPTHPPDSPAAPVKAEPNGPS